MANENMPGFFPDGTNRPPHERQTPQAPRKESKSNKCLLVLSNQSKPILRYTLGCAINHEHFPLSTLTLLWIVDVPGHPESTKKNGPSAGKTAHFTEGCGGIYRAGYGTAGWAGSKDVQTSKRLLRSGGFTHPINEFLTNEDYPGRNGQ